MSQVFTQKDGVIFELLDGSVHDRASFDCGLPVLNDYINNYATQHQNKNLTKVHVATNSSSNIKPIYGYYTLSSSEIYYEYLPKQISKKLPRNYTIPSIKIGRLARDIYRTPKGFGTLLLGDALCRIVRISIDVGIFVIDVNAKNAELAEYYKSFGFVELLNYPNRLIMPSTMLEKMLTLNEDSELLELSKIRLKEKDKAIRVNIEDL